jgi:uncharacterized RDD family membrane protein YckC
MSDTTCPACGRSLPVTARGRIDTVTGLMLAGWWRRVGATIADSMILLIPILFVVSLVDALDGALVGALAGLAVEGLYAVKLTSMPRGQTVGNRVAATRVRDARTGRPLTLAQAAKRWGFIGAYSLIELVPTPAASYVLALCVLVDFLFPLVDPRNQTLHDKFAGVLMVLA